MNLFDDWHCDDFGIMQYKYRDRWGLMLGCELAVPQAPMFDGLSLNPSRQ